MLSAGPIRSHSDTVRTDLDTSAVRRLPESAVRTSGSLIVHRTSRPLQAAGDVIRIGSWQADEDFSVHPKGSQPKRTVICPRAGAPAYLVPGHTYIFKTAKSPWQRFQMWSEYISYRLSKIIGIEVPPCFIAEDELRGRESGILMESFLSLPDSHDAIRLVHGSDLLDRLITDKIRGRPHGVRTNIQVCKRYGVGLAENWWGTTLAFDALIGNTDRHSDNWGILVNYRPSLDLPTFDLAPAYDNATSLGYEIRDDQLAQRGTQRRLESYVERGTHDCGWDHRRDGPSPHMDLCERFVLAYPNVTPVMRKVIGFPSEAVAQLLRECMEFDVRDAFTAGRADLVAGLLQIRRERLKAILGE